MTLTDLRNKLALIQYEIELAEDSRDSLHDLYELRKAYMETILDKVSLQVSVPAPFRVDLRVEP